MRVNESRREWTRPIMIIEFRVGPWVRIDRQYEQCPCEYYLSQAIFRIMNTIIIIRMSSPCSADHWAAPLWAQSLLSPWWWQSLLCWRVFVMLTLESGHPWCCHCVCWRCHCWDHEIREPETDIIGCVTLDCLSDILIDLKHNQQVNLFLTQWIPFIPQLTWELIKLTQRRVLNVRERKTFATSFLKHSQTFLSRLRRRTLSQDL